MAIQGKLRADQVSLAKFSIDRLRELPKMEVLGALTNSKTGQTHGWIDGANVQWSEKTNNALQALFSSIEEDLARTHFDQDSITSSSHTGEQRGLNVPSGGIAEHLGADGVQQA